MDSNSEYEIRKLEMSDYDNGFFECLSELTTAPKIKKSDFKNRLEQLNDDYIILVVIDKSKNIVIGTGAIFFEQKLIRNYALKGYIEDIVVLEKYRGKKIGKLIIMKLIEFAQNRNCYKIVLSTDEKNIGFYTKCGFKKNEVQMVIYQ